MERDMKRIVCTVILCACLTGTLFATGKAEQVSEGDSGTTIIRVGTGDSGEGLNTHQEIIARFEAANPDILVQLEAVAGRDYYTRLLTQFAAKDAPDIMQIGDDAVPMFVDKGALIPLNDYVDGPYPIDLDIYLPGVLDPGRYEGKLYELPKDFSPMGVYYNKKIFDRYGVAYPKDGWTTEDLLDTALALTKDTNRDGKTDLWGVQLTANWTSGFEYFVGAAGGQIISDDGQKYVGYLDSPEVEAAVKAFSDLYHVHRVAPPPADLALWAGGNSEFGNGKAAMRLFGRWPQDGYRKNPNIDLGVVTPPSGAKSANVLFWSGFGISSTSRDPEEAWRFLRFYTGIEGSEVWVQRAIPPVASVARSAGLYSDPIEGAWIRGLNMLVNRAYVYTPHWGSTGDPALRKVLETVLIDPSADIKATLADAAREAQRNLERQQD
jgi:multiple sugar transport system substrate-binding protein